MHLKSLFPFSSVLYGCLLTMAGTAQKKTDGHLENKIDSIFSQYHTSKGPGCAVSIIRNQAVLFEKGYGMANLEYDIPITPFTVFDIASVSKQFTGYAIATLITEGKINPEEDVHHYLPWVPRFTNAITVNHLLHHTSGLRDWPQTLHVAGWRWDEVFSFEDIMRMVKHQQDLDFIPGSTYSYSNTGYNLLASIVEKVSGQSFSTWTDNNIFNKLGMTASHFQDNYTRVFKNVAYSYSKEDSVYKKETGALTAYGSSSLFTSIHDLNKWVIYLQQCVSSNNAVYKQMMEEGRLINGDTVHYGYGLGHGMDRGLKTIAHTGGWQGYRTIILNYPVEQLSIIILSNAAEFEPENYARSVADILLSDRFQKAAAPMRSIRALPTVRPDTTLLRKYTGTYLLKAGWAVTITMEGNQLMTQANGEDKFPIEAKTDSSFWVEAYNAPIVFVKDHAGAAGMLRYKGIDAKKIQPFAPRPDMLPAYKGTYYSQELETAYVIDTVGNQLMAHHARLGDLELLPDPSGPDQFTASIGVVHFVRNAQQVVTGLLVSGGRIKNLRFVKQASTSK